MHPYYQKNKSKLRREMDGYLKLIRTEIEEIFGKPYPQVFSEIWNEYEQEMLEHLPYPGNVRQLANILEYACILCQDGVIDKEDFPEYITRSDDADTGVDSIDEYLSTHCLKDVEKRAIEATLRRCGGKRVATAAQLGISKRGLLNKLKEYGIIDRDAPIGDAD